jgi:hypothetical protein
MRVLYPADHLLSRQVRQVGTDRTNVSLARLEIKVKREIPLPNDGLNLGRPVPPPGVRVHPVSPPGFTVALFRSTARRWWWRLDRARLDGPPD